MRHSFFKTYIRTFSFVFVVACLYVTNVNTTHACIFMCNVDLDGDGVTPNQGDATVFGTSNGNGGYDPNPSGTYAGDNYNNTHTTTSTNTGYTADQVAVMNDAANITDEEIMAMSLAEIQELEGEARVAAEVARARATGRDVTYNADGSVTVETCTNGAGGTFSFETPDPNVPYSQSSYYSQGSYGNSCTAGVDCTCEDRGDCDTSSGVNASLYAFVGDIGDTTISYSSRSRDVYPGKEIWLSWQGLTPDGQPADSCTGIKPDDFTAPNHYYQGSFENNSGGANGVAGVPYPGLSEGQTKTFEVECKKGSATDRAYITLTAQSCTSGCDTPPQIFANGSSDTIFVRYGTSVDVNWLPKTNQACTLSANISSDQNNPNVNDDTRVKIESETTFSISCEGGSDEVTVKVLPTSEET